MNAQAALQHRGGDLRFDPRPPAVRQRCLHRRCRHDQGRHAQQLGQQLCLPARQRNLERSSLAGRDPLRRGPRQGADASRRSSRTTRPASGSCSTCCSTSARSPACRRATSCSRPASTTTTATCSTSRPSSASNPKATPGIDSDRRVSYLGMNGQEVPVDQAYSTLNVTVDRCQLLADGRSAAVERRHHHSDGDRSQLGSVLPELRQDRHAHTCAYQRHADGTDADRSGGLARYRSARLRRDQRLDGGHHGRVTGRRPP